MAHYNSYNLSKSSQVTAESIFKRYSQVRLVLIMTLSKNTDCLCSFGLTAEFFVFLYMGITFFVGDLSRWDVKFIILRRNNVIAHALAHSGNIMHPTNKTMNSCNGNDGRRIDIGKVMQLELQKNEAFDQAWQYINSEMSLNVVEITYEGISKNYSSFVDIYSFLGSDPKRLSYEDSIQSIVYINHTIKFSSDSKYHKCPPYTYIDTGKLLEFLETPESCEKLSVCMLLDICSVPPLRFGKRSTSRNILV